MATDTLYDLLGVPRTANSEEIRAAYRRLSKIYHPDQGGTPAFFRQLQVAHETLTDPIRRAAYDRSLRSAPGPRGQDRTLSAKVQGQGSSQWRPTSQRSGDAGPGYRRLTRTYPGERDYLAASKGDRRRRDVAAVIWVSSVILAAIIVGILLEPTHGIVLLLLVVMAGVAWRRHESVTRRSAIHDRAAQASAEMSRTAMEAAARLRASRAAATEHGPATRDARADDAGSAPEPEREGRDASPDGAYASPEAEEVIEKPLARPSTEPFGDLDEMARMSPAQFEHAMSTLLQVLGMVDVKRVGGGDDLSIDLMAHDSLGRMVMIRCRQCARSETIGLPDVQQLIDVLYLFPQDVCVFVASSEFTPGARELASRHDIQLIKGSEIEELARRRREPDG